MKISNLFFVIIIKIILLNTYQIHIFATSKYIEAFCENVLKNSDGVCSII